MNFGTLDDSRWPMAVVHLEAAPKDMADFERYLGEIDALYERKERFVFVFDARKVGWLEFPYLIRQAQHMIDNEANTIEWISKTAIVAPHPITQGLLRMLFLLRTPSCPTLVFSGYDEALEWVQT